MRLIDVNALKELEPHYSEDGYRVFYEYEIDNAPTVEAIPTELHEKILDKVEGELLECQSNLRPQGEWEKERKYYSDVMKNIYFDCSCSCCGARFPFAQIPETFEDAFYSFNYCPSCGATMKTRTDAD